MSIKNPKLWEQPLGFHADVQEEIATESKPLSNEVTFEDIFPLITQQPLAAGGLRPTRIGINALFKLLGDNVYFLQRGGQYQWDATIPYEQGAVICHNGTLYQSLIDDNLGNEPGIDTAKGASPAWQTFINSAETLASYDNLLKLAQICDKINGTTIITGQESQADLTAKLVQLLGSISQLAKVDQSNDWGAPQNFAQGLEATDAELHGTTKVENLEGASGSKIDFTASSNVDVPTPTTDSPDTAAVNVGYLNSIDVGGDNNVMPPVPSAPLNGAEKVAVMATFSASEYRNNFGTRDPRSYRQFQVRQADAGNWNTPAVDLRVTTDNLTLAYDQRLNGETAYLWRCRDVSEWGQVGGWSTPQSFTTDVEAGILAPTITVTGAPNEVPEDPTITASAFTTVSGTDTHQLTDWRIERVLDSTVVWQSSNDTVNLTSIQVPLDILQESTQYRFMVRYKGNTLGYSNWASVTVTTKGQFVSIQAPTITVTGTPASVPETPTITGGAFSVTTGYTDTHQSTDYKITDISTNTVVWNAYNQTGAALTSVTVPKGILKEATNYRFEMRYRGTTYGYSAWSAVEGTTKAQFTYIATPSLTVTGAPTDVPEQPILSGSVFEVVSDTGETDTHQSTDWRIELASNSELVWESAGNATNLTSITVPAGVLSVSTQYIFKVRYNGAKFGASEWAQLSASTPASFNPINTPQLTVEHDAKGVYEAPLLRGGDYVQNQGEDNRHSATDWRITNTDGTETIWESLSNQVYKTYIQVPSGYLKPSTEYRFMCRYQGSASGWSEWAQVTATTQATFSSTNDIEILSANIDRSGVNSIFDFSLSDVATRPYCTPPVALRLKIYNQTKQNYITEQTVVLDTPNHYVINDANSVEWANSDQIEFQVFYKSNTANDDTGAISAISTKIATVNAPVTVFYDNIDFNQTHILLTEPTLKISFNFYQASWSIESVDYVLRDENDTQTLWQSLNDTATSSKDINFNFNWLTNYILKIKAHARNSDQSTVDSQEMIMHITTAPGSYGTIGIPGQIGFGVGVYPGNDLNELKLTPMPGCDILGNENYGNYQHQNGSIFCFVPAFYYRIGNSQASTYATYGANAVEIANFNVFPDEATANAAGFKLHRAFINGGQVKSGFFCAKYLASKGTNGTSTVPLYVKNGKTISLNSSTYGSNTCGGSGTRWDAITLSKNLGTQYNCETFAIAGAIAILSLAHAQNSTNTNVCAWYDAAGTINFPKGNNNNLRDANDTSVTFTANGDYSGKAQTGSGNPFEKTTHNGQACGITDINGGIWQCVIGFCYISGYKVFADSVDISTITQSNLLTTSNYIAAPSNLGTGRWGNGANSCFWAGLTGAERALDGFWSPSTGTSSNGTNQFGQDYCVLHSYSLFVVSGNWYNSTNAGVFSRYYYGNGWDNANDDCGWRAVAYGGL